MTNAEPTQGQIERTLTQQIQNFYREQIGQRPSKAVCQLFDESLSIVLEQTVSAAEGTMLDAGREELVKKWRWELQETIKPKLKALIEEIVGTSAIAVLIDSDLASGFSCINVILSNTPPVRDRNAIPKANFSWR